LIALNFALGAVLAMRFAVVSRIGIAARIDTGLEKVLGL
jgi:hypothetical protein